MDKIPRLGDRYFHSRLMSDMTERSHSIHVLRQLPALGDISCARSLAPADHARRLWLDPVSAPVALLAAALAVGSRSRAAHPRRARPARAQPRGRLGPLLSRRAHRSLRRARHGAERAVRREHENLLIEWAGPASGCCARRSPPRRCTCSRARAAGVAAPRLRRARGRVGRVAAARVLGPEPARCSARRSGSSRVSTRASATPRWACSNRSARSKRRTNSTQRSGGSAVRITLDRHAEADRRLVEAATRIETANKSISVESDVQTGFAVARDADAAAAPSAAAHGDGPRASQSAGCAPLRGGQRARRRPHVLEGSTSTSPPAARGHRGLSGAGKSSLVGLLLGWHRPAAGRVLVDGDALGAGLARLRRGRPGSIPRCSCGTAPSSTTCATARARPAPLLSRSSSRPSSSPCSGAPRRAETRSARAARWSPAARASGSASAARCCARGAAGHPRRAVPRPRPRRAARAARPRPPALARRHAPLRHPRRRRDARVRPRAGGRGRPRSSRTATRAALAERRARATAPAPAEEARARAAVVGRGVAAAPAPRRAASREARSGSVSMALDERRLAAARASAGALRASARGLALAPAPRRAGEARRPRLAARRGRRRSAARIALGARAAAGARGGAGRWSPTPDVEAMLRRAGPVLLGCRRGRPALPRRSRAAGGGPCSRSAPDRRVRRVPVAALRRALCRAWRRRYEARWSGCSKRSACRAPAPARA